MSTEPRQANLPRGEHRITGHVTRGGFPLPDVTWELTAPFWAGAEIGIYGGYTGPEASVLVLRRAR